MHWTSHDNMQRVGKVGEEEEEEKESKTDVMKRKTRRKDLESERNKV